METPYLQLFRFSTGYRGTPGQLIFDGLPLCSTLEEPWLNNERNISCIPEGEYRVSWERHKKFPYAAAIARLENVPGRSGILIHPGNTLEDIEGCILPGLNFAAKSDPLRIESSGIALERLRRAVNEQTFYLEVRSLAGRM